MYDYLGKGIYRVAEAFADVLVFYVRSTVSQFALIGRYLIISGIMKRHHERAEQLSIPALPSPSAKGK